ncbi:Lamin Tail Domain protein [uncultured archaeon]|nr:Lamin Tail Domain protein [uncultured archaeon]
MRTTSILILVATLMAFSAGLALAEDALNVDNTTAAQSVTNQTDVAMPQETVSKYTQLSNYTKEAPTVLGESISKEYSDVSKIADRTSVFSREADSTTPSVKVRITNINTGENKWVEVANQAVGSWDMTGWTLVSAGNATFTFPALSLDMGTSIRIHEVSGIPTKTDIYTNSTAPLWTDNMITLQDAAGNAVSKYDISAAPTQTVWVNPLNRLIQY